MTRPCFIANWKMNKTHKETEAFLHAFNRLSTKSPSDPADVLIAPPFTALSEAAKTLHEIKSDIGLAAQNVHNEKAGAFTGEISSDMLCALGCGSVIIGHSERRQLFGETNALIHRKLMAAQTAGLRPIFCIGESAEERQAGQTWAIIEKQLSEGLGADTLKVDFKEKISDWLIAYEPVWAIGTGQTPSPEETAEVHKQVGDFFAKRYETVPPRILYGGSVSEKNVEAFMKEKAIDGALIGGASLSVDSFFQIVALGARTKRQAAPAPNSR